MKNLLHVILALCIVTACSKDDSTDDMIPISYDNLVVTTTVNEIGLDGAKISLSTNISIPTNATKTILYRENGAGSFQETNNELLTSLTSGKKHEVKTRVTINGNSYDSELEIFITKGYIAGSQIFADVDILNEKFHMLFLDGVQSEFAQPLVAYAKVGQDSVQVQNISYENNKLSFDIDAETQDFFENDAEYISNKAFTLGFFSGDYYQHIEPTLSEINYDGEITSRWNFFNKKPLIDSYTIIENSSCLGADNRKGLLDIKGKFWGLRSGASLTPGVSNIPDNLTIRLTNINDASIEKVYFIVDHAGDSNVYIECDLEQFNLLHEIIDGANKGFHSDNYLRIRFNTNYIIPGDYKITFAAEKDNVVQISDELNVVIE